MELVDVLRHEDIDIHAQKQLLLVVWVLSHDPHLVESFGDGISPIEGLTSHGLLLLIFVTRDSIAITVFAVGEVHVLIRLIKTVHYYYL